MGLDVYLVQCDDLAAELAKEDEYIKKEKELYDDSIETKKRQHALTKLADELGLDEYGSSKLIRSIELNSDIDSSHTFKVGYFRSSYNDAGLNSVLMELGLPTLDDIFSDPKKDYYRQPCWDTAADYIATTLDAYDDIMKSDRGKYKAISLSSLWSKSAITSKKDALDLFLDESDRTLDTNFKSYSNLHGDFFLDGLQCFAIINGTDSLGTPRPYAIVERFKDGNKDDWYKKALKIVQETIEYVQEQSNRDTFYLRWSSA